TGDCAHRNDDGLQHLLGQRQLVALPHLLEALPGFDGGFPEVCLCDHLADLVPLGRDSYSRSDNCHRQKRPWRQEEDHGTSQKDKTSCEGGNRLDGKQERRNTAKNSRRQRTKLCDGPLLLRSHPAKSVGYT